MDLMNGDMVFYELVKTYWRWCMFGPSKNIGDGACFVHLTYCELVHVLLSLDLVFYNFFNAEWWFERVVAARLRPGGGRASPLRFFFHK